MGRQDSYQNALATIERSRTVDSQNKANREVLERLAKLKEREISPGGRSFGPAPIADVERRRIAAEVEKEKNKTSERIKSKFFIIKSI